MPKRSEIRTELGKQQFTDAQLRGAIARLGLPTEDGYDYSDEQSAQIKEALLQVCKPQQEATPPVQTAQNPLDRDAAALLYLQEQERSTTDAIALIEATRGALERKQAERQQALEQLTDWDTYLDDPIAFLADFAQLKARKLADNKARVEGLLQTSKAYQAPIVWESPQYEIAPSSIAGCLPI